MPQNWSHNQLRLLQSLRKFNSTFGAKLQHLENTQLAYSTSFPTRRFTPYISRIGVCENDETNPIKVVAGLAEAAPRCDLPLFIPTGTQPSGWGGVYQNLNYNLAPIRKTNRLVG